MVRGTCADCCLKGHHSLFSEMFHPFSPRYETNAADRYGASTAEPQNEKLPVLPLLLNPLAWHPLPNANLKDNPIQALQLKSGANEMASFSSKIQCSHLPGDTAQTNTALGPGNVAAAKNHSPHDHDALPVPALCCSCS